MENTKWPIYDNESQLNRIKSYLISNEILYSVFDCKGVGTGFVGVTDKRIIFYDQEFMSITKHKSMVSIPYSQIIGIACADDGLIFKTSTVTLITAAGRFNFEFRGMDKAQWIYQYLIQRILT